MKKLITIIILMIVSSICYGAENQSANAGAFLERGVGARPHSLGGAFTALSNDSNAVIYNSAGLASIKNIQLDSMYTKQFGDVNQSYFGGVMPLGNSGTLGVAYFSTGVDGIKRTNWDGFRGHDTGETFGYGAKAIMLGYGNRISKEIALGATAKLINESLDNAHSNGIGLDLGLLYTPLRDVNIGLNLQNVNMPAIKWSTGEVEKMPLKATIGAAAKISDVTVLSDVTIRKNRNAAYGLGMEYNYQDMLFVRGGLNNGSLTCGAGIKYDIYNLNYAFTGSADGVLENNNTFSFGLNFDSVVAQAATEYKPSQLRNATVKIDVLTSTVVKPSGNLVSFKDLVGHWGKDSVEDIASLGLVNGRPNGKFDPNGLIKKVEATKIVLYAYKVKKQAGNAEISVKLNKDVTEETPIRLDVYNEYGVLVKSLASNLNSAVAEKKIAWDGTDKNNNVVADGVYKVRVVVENPYEEIDSEKELHVTSKFVDVDAPEKSSTQFKDVAVSHWASGIISEAVQLGIINGETDILFNPGMNFSKLDLVVSIAKALEIEGYKADLSVKIPYVDADQIPQADVNLVKTYITVLGAGGNQSGALNPDKNLSRVEAATILERYLTTKKVFETKTNDQVTNKVKETEANDINLQVYKIDSKKIVIKGVAKGVKALIVAGKLTAVSSEYSNVNVKVEVKENEEIPVQIIDNNNVKIEMVMSFPKGKAVLKGLSAKKELKVNQRVVVANSAGKFYSKVNTNSNNNQLLQISIKNNNSTLAEK